MQTEGAGPFVPRTRSLKKLTTAARTCRGCELFRDATQTVFGSRPEAARFVLVGEQPGDLEDGTVSRSSARPAASWIAP